eukprot:m.259853 g.259853  ORF g.259853 m.259853 type:complete len:205 (+) comp38815_c0_seq1:242-856(+)
MATKKDQGNGFFVAGQYEEAIAKYDEAILESPTEAMFYGNRCAAKHKLCRFREALDDATKACELDPTWAKGYIRKSQVLRMLHRAPEALSLMETVSKDFTDDKSFLSELENVKKAVEFQQAETEFKGKVVDFAVNKTAGESHLQSKEYEKAASSYGSTIALMEQMIAKLPAEQAEPLKLQLSTIRLKMKNELETKSRENNSSKK